MVSRQSLLGQVSSDKIATEDNITANPAEGGNVPSLVGFEVITRNIVIGERIPALIIGNEVIEDTPEGPVTKPVTARAIISFLGITEFIFVMFLTEDSPVPQAVTQVFPPGALIYLPSHLLDSWLSLIQIKAPMTGLINHEHPEQTKVEAVGIEKA